MSLSVRDGYRVVHGIEVPEKPSGDRRFTSERIRWMVVADGLLEVASCLPRNAYALHAGLMELYAAAQRRYVELRGADAQGELFDADGT